MKVKRQEFLDILNTVVCGTHKMEVLEQSHCFIFTPSYIIAFNGEIFAKAKFPNGLCGDDDPLVSFAVPADDLIQLIAKLPDKELKLKLKEKQLMIYGKRKKASLTIEKKIILPVEDIPTPKKMKKIKEGVMESLIIAAKVCSTSDEDYRVNHVQISPDKIQATDKLRFLRITIDTGLKTILVPAGAILAVKNIPITRINVQGNWLFIKNKKVKLGICCTKEEYYEDALISTVIKIKKSSSIQFPKEMTKIIDRAIIMAKDDYTQTSKIKLTSKSITIRTQKESGWYEERHSAKFKGDDMEIYVGLSLFKDLLAKTHKARVNQNKIKMKKDGIEFVVALGK